MPDVLLAFNAGSTSLKFAAYRLGTAPSLQRCVVGRIQAMQAAPCFVAKGPAGETLARHEWSAGPVDHDEALRFTVAWLQGHLAGSTIRAAGHRMMLGGARFDAPVRIDHDVLAYLDGLSAFEPSHQPFNVQGARTVAALMPELPQVACFDSSFHRTLPESAYTLALPKEVRDAGVRRWGYHGLSFEYVGERLREVVPQARRVVVAHLGGGSSLCAMLDGFSVETTMGLAGLSGPPMATRSGDLPPEALLYLLRSGLFDGAALERMLYERGGLLGLSGFSGDMRLLQDSAEPGAVLAVQHFVHALTKHVGAFAAVLGGLDALVFTAGIGEHSHQVRSALCRRLAGLGVVLDERANVANRALISPPGAPVSVHVIPTDEELVVARHTRMLAGLAPGPYSN